MFLRGVGGYVLRCVACHEIHYVSDRLTHLKEKHNIVLPSEDYFFCVNCKKFYIHSNFYSLHLKERMNPPCMGCFSKVLPKLKEKQEKEQEKQEKEQEKQEKEKKRINSVFFETLKKQHPGRQVGSPYFSDPQKLLCKCINGHISCFKGVESYKTTCWCLSPLLFMCPCGMLSKMDKKEDFIIIANHLNFHKLKHELRILDCCKNCKNNKGVLICNNNKEKQ